MKGLEGIKVGATIYKIEPASGDEYRTNAPGFGMKKTDIDDPSFDFASMNKTFVSINLKSDEGHELIEKMLADADIIERAREDARSVVEKDPTLAKHPSLARTIDRALDADREAFLGRG